MPELQVLIDDLKRLRDSIPPGGDTPAFQERLRTIQNVGGYMIRNGRLDKIIEGLEFGKQAIDENMTRADQQNAGGKA